MAIQHVPITRERTRRPAGTPTGGQFAPDARAEPGVALAPVPAASGSSDLPDWGPDLASHLLDEVDERVLDRLSFQGEGSKVDLSLPEMLDVTPADLTERYGEVRGGWLASLRVFAVQDSEVQAERPSMDGPGFWESCGHFTLYRQVRDGGEETLDEGAWNNEDGLDTRIPLELCPEP